MEHSVGRGCLTSRTKLQKQGVLDAAIGGRSEVLFRLKDEVNPQWCSLIFRRIFMKFNKNNHCRSYIMQLYLGTQIFTEGLVVVESII